MRKSYIMLHGNSKVFAPANSSLLVTQGLKYDVDILELDVRKSKDHTLYCYHGGLLALILRFLKFKDIQNFLNVEKLEDILQLVVDKKMFFLDLKERTIDSNSLEYLISQYPQKFWLAGYSLKHLYFLKEELNQNILTVYNFGFLFFNISLKRAKKYKIDAIKIFWWQCNDKNIKRLHEHNISYTIHHWLMSKKKYKTLVDKYGSLWEAVDDPRNLSSHLR